MLDNGLERFHFRLERCVKSSEPLAPHLKHEVDLRLDTKEGKEAFDFLALETNRQKGTTLRRVG
jgi:hypothetical protein